MRVGMEGYLSIKETAEKWGVSERRINQYCTEGRIPGAQKFGKSWAIPESAEKPDDPRKKRERTEKKVKEKAERRPWEHSNLMPLMNTDFAPGQVKEAVEAPLSNEYQQVDELLSREHTSSEKQYIALEKFTLGKISLEEVMETLK